MKNLFKLIITSFLLLLAVSSLSAAVVTTPAIRVTAELSRNRVSAGEMVQLDVKVSGTQEADLPRDLSLNGLKLTLAGESSQVQMVNYSISSSVNYSYIVTPLQTGTFTIPSIPVRVQGKIFQTPLLQLTVVDSSSKQSSPPVTALINGVPIPSASSPAPSSSATSSRVDDVSLDQLAFGELIIAKKKLFVGEVVPAEVRFYVDAHYNAQPRSDVLFNEEGLLVERFAKPKSEVVQRNGRTYNVVTLRTLVSAVKSGPLEMTPASLTLLLELPGAVPPGVPDVIAQLMGQARGGAQGKQVKITTNKLSLEVVPLPQEGKPEGFSGAIGEFRLTANASPSKLPPGDPLTLSLKIEGKGNFKAFNAPQLTDTEGWKLYPSTDRFEPTDSLGWSGTKTFETTMISQQQLPATPGALFSYFDPTSAKYVTLTTKPVPLEKSPLAAANTPAPTISNPVAPAVTPPSVSIQDQLLGEFSNYSWLPPFYRKSFIIGSGILGVILMLCFVYLGVEYRLRTTLLRDREKLRLKKLWEELHQENLVPLDFFNKAGEMAELLLQQDPSKQSVVEGVVKRRDEINYGAREVVLRNEERKKILEALSSMKKVFLMLLFFFLALDVSFAEPKEKNASDDTLSLPLASVVELFKSSTGSPERYYNEALTAESQGKQLEALLALRRALILDPRLSIAQDRFESLLKKMGLPHESSWKTSLAKNCSPEWLVLLGSLVGWSAALLFVGMLFVALGRIDSQEKNARWPFVLVLFFFFVGHGIAFLGNRIDPRTIAQEEMMIMNAPKGGDLSSFHGVPLRSTPADTASLLSQLPPGVCVTLLSHHGFWSYVKTASGQKGWVPSGSLEPLIPVIAE